MKFSKSRLTIPSSHDWSLVEQGKQLVDDFEKEVDRFYTKWEKEITRLDISQDN